MRSAIQQATVGGYYVFGEVPNLGFTLIAGNTVPSDTASGFAPGCIFLQIDSTTPGQQVYINEGSATSCDFNPIVLPGVDLSALVTTAAELNLLSGLLSTAAEINRATDVSTRLVSLAVDTPITLASHEGKTLVLGGAGSARTMTLPAATGTGGIYRFLVGAVNTSNYVIQVTGNDVMYGNIWTNSTGDTPDLGQPWPTAADSDTITLNGTTQGGAAIGDEVVLQDIAADTWQVLGFTTSSGAEATPFSAAVT